MTPKPRFSRRFVYFAAPVALACGAAAPSSASVNAPLYFDCDVPEARSSSVRVGGGTAVRAAFRITPRMRRGGATPTAAGVMLGTADGKETVAVQIRQASPNAATFTLSVDGRSAGSPFSRPLGEIAFDGFVDAVVEVGADGLGAIRIGSMQAPLQLGGAGAQKTVSAYCIAGHFRFDPLIVTAN